MRLICRPGGPTGVPDDNPCPPGSGCWKVKCSSSHANDGRTTRGRDKATRVECAQTQGTKATLKATLVPGGDRTTATPLHCGSPSLRSRVAGRRRQDRLVDGTQRSILAEASAILGRDGILAVGSSLRRRR